MKKTLMLIGLVMLSACGQTPVYPPSTPASDNTEQSVTTLSLQGGSWVSNETINNITFQTVADGINVISAEGYKINFIAVGRDGCFLSNGISVSENDNKITYTKNSVAIDTVDMDLSCNGTLRLNVSISKI